MFFFGFGGLQLSMLQFMQWLFVSDEKWEMDCKNEVFDLLI